MSEQENKVRVRILGNRVLIKQEKEMDKTEGGIFIPPTAREKTQEGSVVVVGDGNEVGSVSVNDVIIYDKYAGTLIKVEGEEYIILNIDHVLAVYIEGEE